MDPSSHDVKGSSTCQPFTSPRHTSVKNTYVNAPNQVISSKDVLPYPKYIPVAKKAGGRKKRAIFHCNRHTREKCIGERNEEREAKRIKLEEKKRES